MKKKIINIIKISAITIILLLFIVAPVFAAPGIVVFYNPQPSNTSIILTWAPAPASTSTLIRYSTDTYPLTVADGDLAYNGTGFQDTVSGLVSGTTYYFSAWGFDGANYSASPANWSS